MAHGCQYTSLGIWSRRNMCSAQPLTSLVWVIVLQACIPPQSIVSIDSDIIDKLHRSFSTLISIGLFTAVVVVECWNSLFLRRYLSSEYPSVEHTISLWWLSHSTIHHLFYQFHHICYWVCSAFYNGDIEIANKLLNTSGRCSFWVCYWPNTPRMPQQLPLTAVFHQTVATERVTKEDCCSRLVCWWFY